MCRRGWLLAEDCGSELRIGLFYGQSAHLELRIEFAASPTGDGLPDGVAPGRGARQEEDDGCEAILEVLRVVGRPALAIDQSADEVRVARELCQGGGLVLAVPDRRG